MARLIYTALTSLDGYTNDADGNFEWAHPDEEVHGFVNDLERPIGTYLLGRRMYEVMSFWEAPPGLADAPPVIQDYASVWKGADKIVYSTTLSEVTTARTQLEPTFVPDDVRRLKESATRDLSVGGAGLAGHALAAGLVDELRLILAPVTVGAGTHALHGHPALALELLDERRFASGFVYLRYAIKN